MLAYENFTTIKYKLFICNISLFPFCDLFASPGRLQKKSFRIFYALSRPYSIDHRYELTLGLGFWITKHIGGNWFHFTAHGESTSLSGASRRMVFGIGL